MLVRSDCGSTNGTECTGLTIFAILATAETRKVDLEGIMAKS